MKAIITKHLIVFLFLFSVLERAGVSVISLIGSDTEIGHELLLQENENSAKETNIKDLSPKEYVTASLMFIMPDPFLNDGAFIEVPGDQKSAISFYPSVPTPPPDLC